MNIIYAKKLWEYMKSGLVKKMYDAEIYSDGRKVRGFHKWADNKKTIGIIRLNSKAYGEILYFLILDWRQNGNIYLIVFPSNKKGPLIEIHRLESMGSKLPSFRWIYSPSKKDDKNKKRLIYFKKHFISTDVNINLDRKSVV